VNQINVTFRHVDPSQALKDYVIGNWKIGKVVEKSFDAHVTCPSRSTATSQRCSDGGGITIKAFESTEDLYSAIDLVCDKVERQLKKYREKRKDKGRRSSRADGVRIVLTIAKGRPAQDRPHGQLSGQADDGGGCGAASRPAPARRGDVREPGNEPAERGFPAADGNIGFTERRSMRIQDIIPRAVVDGLLAETKEGSFANSRR